MQKKDYLSATTLSKKTAATLESLENGESEKLIILKNNAPMNAMRLWWRN
jgi:antitoxin StbD